MRLLLDTSTFLWYALDAPQLSARARELCRDSGNELYLSGISDWEIAVKYSQRRLPLPLPAHEFVPRYRAAHGIQPLPFDEAAALCAESLPWIHKDPFDRMLICQAITHQMALVTDDRMITQYPIRVIW